MWLSSSLYGPDSLIERVYQVERISPNLDAGYPWLIPVTVWQGHFSSQPELEDYDHMENELREAAAAYGITLDNFFRGEIVVNSEQDKQLQDIKIRTAA